MVNLILAFFWLLTALGCFLFWSQRWDIGLLALVLCGYNVIRWRSMRSVPRPPRAAPSRPATLSREPDLNFDFTEQAPRRPPDVPPRPTS